MCFTRGRRRHCFCPCPLSLSCVCLVVCVCVCVCFSFHSLWHSSCRCGRRSLSVLRWPRSPPRWRRGLRCEAGRTPPWRRGGGMEQRERWRTAVWLTGMKRPDTRNTKLMCNAKISDVATPAETMKWTLWRRMLYPLLNFLNGGRMTLLLFTTQCRPTLTLARSPLMMQSFMTIVWRTHTHTHTHTYTRTHTHNVSPHCIIQFGACLFFSTLTLPLRTMFWLPHSTDCLLTLLPEAW